MADVAGAVHWLRIAIGDLAAARRLLVSDEVPQRAAAELAQQAAEKALKAALALNGLDPPRIHDVVALARLAGRWETPPADVPIAVLAALTDAASVARYPDSLEIAYTAAEVNVLVTAAVALVDWMRARLVDVGVTPDELGAI